MATTIQIKRSANVAAPTTADLLEGELAYSYDKGNNGDQAKLYIEVQDASGNESIHTIGGKYYTSKVDAATSANTVSTIVSRDALGNFTTNTITANSFVGNITGTINGVASSASKLETARRINLGGDLEGNVLFDGTQDVTIFANVINNSVTLGTDTVGEYVANLTAGTGISLSGFSSESANITVTNTGVTAITGTVDQITASSSNGAITLSLPNDVTVNNNLTVQGNLFIKGTATTLQTATVNINDSLVKFGNANPGNSVDLGFFGEYVDGGNVNYSGLYRDHNDGKFRIFQGSTVNPSGNTISTTDSGYTIASLVANLTGGTISGLTANIAVGDGGTGRGTFTTNGILFGNATGALKVTAAGTYGQVLQASVDGTPVYGGVDGGTY
jgi:hypothetical protein